LHTSSTMSIIIVRKPTPNHRLPKGSNWKGGRTFPPSQTYPEKRPPRHRPSPSFPNRVDKGGETRFGKKGKRPHPGSAPAEVRILWKAYPLPGRPGESSSKAQPRMRRSLRNGCLSPGQKHRRDREIILDFCANWGQKGVRGARRPRSAEPQ